MTAGSTAEHRKIIWVSIAIMAGGVLAVGTVSGAWLYRTALDVQRGRLVEVVQSRARLIEAVARFDREYSAEDVPGGAWAATLSQLRDAHARFAGFGETGEFTLARREGDRIVFLLSHRHGLEDPPPVPVDSEIAEPMRRALSGESGTLVGLDYRGVEVLAAHEPLAGLDMGIVAKIDLAEIRAPFIRATLYGGLGAVGIIFLGAFLLVRSVNPLMLRSQQHARDTARALAVLESANALHESVQRDLKSQGRLLDGLFGYGPLGVAIVGAERRFERVSDSLSVMLGYEPGELVGLTIADITHPDDIEQNLRMVESLRAGTTSSFRIEKRYITKDGKHIWAMVNVSALPAEDGGTHYTLSLIEDITHRKKIQQELAGLAASLEDRVAERTRELDASRLAALNMMGDAERDRREIQELNATLERRVAARTSELERANRELEAFSYSVSHDLKAPLRAIAGFSHVIEREHGDKLDEEGLRLLGVVVDKTEQMGQLIDDLLAFSSLGRAEFRPVETDVAAVSRTVFEGIKSLDPERAVELELGEMPAARGDSTQIRQLLTNLIANAFKFTGPREKAVIEVGSLRERGEDVYYVRDNGVGFDMAYVGKLFGVFQRLHYPDEFPGTGVGLAIVHRVVERHGGRVWAEGRPGEGATFYFTLPGGPDDTLDEQPA